MIRFKLVDRRTSVSKRIDELKQKLEELPKEFMKALATEIVFQSPVDTGTYMEAHNIGETTGVTTSKGKPKKQPFEPYAQAALNKLFDQIDSLPETPVKQYISNNSAHAWKVEYEYGYEPYTIARAKAQILLDDTVRKLSL